jgi:XTP/dITP diphosphohydrolase
MSGHRWLAPGPLVIASHNPGKVREITELLGPYGIEPVSAAALNLPEPEETEDTFIGNARLKSRAAATATGMVALSDDSGLCVDGLDGAPGLYSARWAGPDKDFSVAMQRVRDELENKNIPAPRGAHFVCALSLAWPDNCGDDGEGYTEDFEGKIFGTLVWPRRGSNGFGYDPMFQPDGYHMTFGEMAPAEKHAINHRAIAFRLLVDACLTR